MLQAVSLLKNGETLIGMRGDISQAIGGNMDLLAFLPPGREAGGKFISMVYSEARRKRKRSVFLAPDEDIPWIQSVIVETRGKENGREGIMALPDRLIRCQEEDVPVTISDLIHHCMQAGNINGCPLQSGFDLDLYRDIKSSGGNLIPDMEEELREKGMCPSRVAMDIAMESEVIVAGYGFLFNEDPDDTLSLIEKGGRELLLAVHDPSALLEYLSERFRYRWEAGEPCPALEDNDTLSEGERKGMEILVELFSRMAGVTDPKKQISRSLLVASFRERVEKAGLRITLSGLRAALRRALGEGRTSSVTERKNLKRIELMLGLWMDHYSGVSRVRRDTEEGNFLEVSLIDNQVICQPLMERFSSTILFGDTLYPHNVFMNSFGIRPEKAMNRSYSNEEMLSGTTLVSLGNVDLSYKHRNESTYGKIVENIKRITETTPGLSVCIFPSHFLLQQVMDSMMEHSFDRTLLVEDRGMGRDERRSLLLGLRDSGDAVALGVQGGTIARAVLDGSLEPDSVVMIGMHLRPPDPAVDQMKLHLQKRYGPSTGHVMTILMPAVWGVVRMVNALSSTGRSNLLVLMDRRYQDRRVLECMPRSYRIRLLRDEREFDGDRLLASEVPV
ncbi:hypothetical protein B6U90_03410 [Thermoplasmatales archaeon ex4484_6]|nr:MAG: hypothetical protein B6U90_03410 [Thermoplasmatales archaeon ex4484_6]